MQYVDRLGLGLTCKFLLCIQTVLQAFDWPLMKDVILYLGTIDLNSGRLPRKQVFYGSMHHMAQIHTIWYRGILYDGSFQYLALLLTGEVNTQQQAMGKAWCY